MERALAVIADIDRQTAVDNTADNKQLQFDLSLLCASDSTPLDQELFSESRDEYLKQLATDNFQLLLKQLQKLPSECVEDVIVHKLPADGAFRLPREKPLPKPKPPTKWQQFVRSKGIPLRSKEKKIWDKELKRWVPRYGSKKVLADREKNWVREVPANVDPNTDMFAKAAESKRERIAKNELNRLRNIKRSNRVPTVGITPKDISKRDTTQLGDAAALARRSTASLGRFSRQLSDDVPKKQLGATSLSGNTRRHFDTCTGNTRAEIDAQLKMLDTLGKRAAVVDNDKAANRLINREQSERHDEKNQRKNKKGGSSKKRWIPNSKKGDKQRKAIARKSNSKKTFKGKKR